MIRYCFMCLQFDCCLLVLTGSWGGLRSTRAKNKAATSDNLPSTGASGFDASVQWNVSQHFPRTIFAADVFPRLFCTKLGCGGSFSIVDRWPTCFARLHTKPIRQNRQTHICGASLRWDFPGSGPRKTLRSAFRTDSAWERSEWITHPSVSCFTLWAKTAGRCEAISPGFEVWS